MIHPRAFANSLWAGLDTGWVSSQLKRQAGSVPCGELVPPTGRDPGVSASQKQRCAFPLPFQIQGSVSFHAATASLSVAQIPSLDNLSRIHPSAFAYGLHANLSVSFPVMNHDEVAKFNQVAERGVAVTRCRKPAIAVKMATDEGPCGITRKPAYFPALHDWLVTQGVAGNGEYGVIRHFGTIPPIQARDQEVRASLTRAFAYGVPISLALWWGILAIGQSLFST